MATKRVTPSDLTDEFVSKSVRYRGHNYTVTELSMAKYDKTMRQATETDEDTGVEKFDAIKHNRILIAQTVKVDGEPVDVEDLYQKGTRLVRQLIDLIREVHFEDEPEEDEDEATVEEGEALAEAK